MSEDDNSQIKEEISDNIKNIEEKLINLLNIRELKIEEEINNLNSKINETIEKTNITIENYSSQQLDHKKIIELEAFKNKVDAMLITHEIRIKNNSQDLIKFQSKYDKTICDNLLVPGFIGTACQFRNLGEFITNNINEISRIKIEKEQYKKDSKDFKTKLESMLKQMIVLNDSTIGICTKYADNKQKDIEQLLDGKMVQYIDQVREIRVLFSEFQNKIDKQINQFKSDMINILNLKDEIIQLVDEKNKNLEKFIHEVHKKAVLNIQDIGILKKKVNEINELNSYYSKNFFSKKNSNSLKKRDIIRTVNIMNKSNMINTTNNREDSDKDYYFKNINNNTLNTLSSNIPNKESEFLALNFDSFPDTIIHSNLNRINNTYFNKIQKKKENEKINEIEIIKKEKEKDKIFLKKENKLINNNGEIILKDKTKEDIKRNLYNDLNQVNKNENNTKTDSFDNLFIESHIIPKIVEPFILERKILSNKELKKEKDKKIAKKEVIKKHLQKNLMNYKVISGNNPLDLYNYSTSVPKLSKYPKKDNSITKFKNKRINRLEDIKYKQDSIKSKTLSHLNNYKLVNLELEDNATINPDTNNGAYTIAHKQTENSNISKLSITPTSYVKVYDASKKTSRLLNMTFAKEEPNKDKNYFLRTAYNESGRNKIDF